MPKVPTEIPMNEEQRRQKEPIIPQYRHYPFRVKRIVSSYEPSREIRNNEYPTNEHRHDEPVPHSIVQNQEQDYDPSIDKYDQYFEREHIRSWQFACLQTYFCYHGLNFLTYSSLA